VHETPEQETRYRREAGYAGRYRDHRFRSGYGALTDRRERRALRALLARAGGGSGPWLDVPCGAGRLSGELRAPVVQVDRDLAMLQVCTGEWPRVRASAHALPFAEGTFAGILCHRLLQHIPGADERVRILRELARTSRGPIIVSFFDSCCLQHLRRILRRAFGKQRSGRGALSRGAFARELAAAGLRPLRWQPLRRFVAEQTLVLCTRVERPSIPATSST
jgi:SAM-dependent methyltransferase